ncbi:hypothetical protein C8R45DRAFT_1162116 [Mycena sanguinolenta]|nr:hypothetical protein C8R45DRAFT_1162116 [Mycena sanguinolenta]
MCSGHFCRFHITLVPRLFLYLKSSLAHPFISAPLYSPTRLMANYSSAQVTTGTSPEQELAALVSQVAALSMAAIDMSRHCLEVHDKETSKAALEMARQCLDINRADLDSEKVPRIVRAHVDATIAEYRSPTPAFYEHEAPTPDHIESMFPAGRGENKTWHVVCIGRQPGLYGEPEDAEEQVRGVPSQSRCKVVGRAAALAHYRQMYESGKVMRLTEELP